MKALLPLSIVATLMAAPAFAGCVAPLNDIRIPNGNKATMDEIVAANYALQENTTEVEAYAHCLKAEQQAKIASEYVNRLKVENDKLQNLADRYNEEVRNFRARQAAQKSTEQSDAEAAAVRAAEQDAAEKARHDAPAKKAGEGAEKPVPRSN